MPTLRLVDGLPLVVGGSLATADACCCGGSSGACCLPATCCIEGNIDWGDTPSESWGTPPGWVWIGVLDPDNSPSNVSYNLCIPDTAETPCDINATHWQAEIAALIAWAQDQGLPSENVAWSGVSSVAASCEAAESQLACEGQGGTFYAGQTCEDNPCPAPPPDCSDSECFTAIDADPSDCPEGCYCLGYDAEYAPETPGACNANEFP